MLSFRTRSYIEGIKNAIMWVDFVPRRWDVFNADETIINIVASAVPFALGGFSKENEWYEGVEELWKLAEKIRECDSTDEEKERFAELLGKHLYHLWY